MYQTELEKVEQKRSIYTQNAFLLSVDSLTGDVLNPEFEAVDRELYSRIQKKLQFTGYVDRMILQLKSGTKIRLGWC